MKLTNERALSVFELSTFGERLDSKPCYWFLSISLYLKQNFPQVVVMQTFNPSTWVAVAGRSLWV